MSRESAQKLLHQQLLESSEEILRKDSTSALGIAMRRLFPEITQAFVLAWIPDQGEDFYWLLVSASDIAIIEIPRDRGDAGSKARVEMTKVATYRNGMSKGSRRQLDAALDLMASANDKFCKLPFRGNRHT